MRLLFIRHAIAVPRGTPGIPDDERPLTPEGEKRFRKAARGLARIAAPPEILLTSPLPRARKTAEIAAQAWGGKVRLRNVPALAGGTWADLQPVLESYPRKSIIGLVGHEPHLSHLLAKLIRAREGDRLTFRKGGAALIDLGEDLPAGGTLLWFIPPRILRKAAEP